MYYSQIISVATPFLPRKRSFFVEKFSTNSTIIEYYSHIPKGCCLSVTYKYKKCYGTERRDEHG